MSKYRWKPYHQDLIGYDRRVRYILYGETKESVIEGIEGPLIILRSGGDFEASTGKSLEINGCRITKIRVLVA